MNPTTEAGWTLLDRVAPHVGDQADPEEDWVAQEVVHRSEIGHAIVEIEVEARRYSLSRLRQRLFDQFRASGSYNRIAIWQGIDRALNADVAALSVGTAERLTKAYDDLAAELETEDFESLLSDAEVETIYAAYQLVICLEARTIKGRRDIVEPLYRAVLQARINTARDLAR